MSGIQDFPNEAPSKVSSNLLIYRLRAEVDKNLQNEQFGVTQLSECVNMSRSNLHRKLQEATGQSISQFIREYRLERALEILQNEGVSVSEAALRYLRSWSFSNSLAFNITNWWEIQADLSVYYQIFKTSQFQSNFTEEVLTTNFNATNNINLSRNYSLEISGSYQSNVLYGIWKTPSMGQLDIGIRKKLNNGKGTLTLSATDILDTSIWKWEANVPGINALLNGS